MRLCLRVQTESAREGPVVVGTWYGISRCADRWQSPFGKYARRHPSPAFHVRLRARAVLSECTTARHTGPHDNTSAQLTRPGWNVPLECSFPLSHRQLGRIGPPHDSRYMWWRFLERGPADPRPRQTPPTSRLGRARKRERPHETAARRWGKSRGRAAGSLARRLARRVGGTRAVYVGATHANGRFRSQS